MTGNRRTYSCVQLVSAFFMILALLWLTISAPFVVASQKHIAKFEEKANGGSPLSDCQEDNTNPFGNNTEEKSSSTVSFSEEYLHDHHKTDHFISTILRYHKCENADTYTAYHGELLVPPPNQA